MARKKLSQLDTVLAGIRRSGELVGKEHYSALHTGSLYHYTSSDGLRGILVSNSLRFSDPLFLNDGSEVYYANQLLRSVLDEFVYEKEASVRRLAFRFRDLIARTAVDFRPVIFCMSEEPDLLNQWRDYGRDIVPYCIEFDPTGLLQTDWSFNCDLVRMIYDEATQRAILLGLINGIFKSIEGQPQVLFKREQRNELIGVMVSEVWGALVTFKNPAFAAEKEWRLLGNAAYVAGQPIQFRTGPLGVTPYLERLPRVSTLLPVQSVGVGPSPYGSLSRLALERFLQSRGHNSSVAWASGIPAR